MEIANIKKIIQDYEDLTGKMKDTKDFNCIINSILKKKNSKNQIEILINFFNNLNQIKSELKSDKKIQKSLYSSLFSPNGEEIFIKEFLSKLEDRSCTNLLDQLKENLSKLSHYQNIFSSRLTDSENIFYEMFKLCKDHNELIEKMMASNFIEENVVFHFLNFWNKSLDYNGNSLQNVFSNKNNFKDQFLKAFKETIIFRKYSRNFLKEMINKKLPEEFESLLKELHIHSRIKIDNFLDEFPRFIKFEELLFYLFEHNSDRYKIHLFYDFLNEMKIFESEYNAVIFSGSIFEEIFKGLFINKFAVEFFNQANYLFNKSQKFFDGLKIHFSNFEIYSKELENFQKIIRTANPDIIKFIESIRGHSYEVISTNLLQFTLDEYGFNLYSLFLKEKLNPIVSNYILLNDDLSKHQPILDIIIKSKDKFLENTFNSLIQNKKFKQHKVIILNTAANLLENLDKNLKSKINDIKISLKEEERKKLRHIYSRYLAYEYDIYFILDFIPKSDYENLSLLINRLIRSKMYDDAFVVLMYSDFDPNIHIEEEYEYELFNYNIVNFKKSKRFVKFVEGEEENILHDQDYDQNYDEIFDMEEYDDDLNSSRMSSLSIKSKKSKKVLDYIMYYEYIKPKKTRHANYYQNLLKYQQFNPNVRFNHFGPITPNCLYLESLGVPKANVLIIDTLEGLKNSVALISKKLCIDFEYAKETISLMQISDKNNVYIIDYLKLISNMDFFPVFNQKFKNSSFISFSMDGSDLKMMNDDFRRFFESVPVEDIQKIYNRMYDTKNSPSLSNLAYLLLNKPMCKYYQCSNWDKRPLLESQIHYAALDSYVLYKIYSELEKINTSSLNDRKHLCDFIHRKHETKLKEKLVTFANSQIQFLESERQIMEQMNEQLKTLPLDVNFFL
jgi:nitrate reductase assembly molybdenum cofactor insertion protein NarJ